MVWQYTPYTAPVFLSAVVGLAVASFALAHRDRPGATPLAVFMLGAGVWSFAEGMNLAHADLVGKVFWTRVEIAVSGVVPLAFLALVLEYTGNEEWLRHPAAYVVALEPVVMAAVTFGAPELVRESTGLTLVGSYWIITEVMGPAYYLHLLFAYSAIAIAGALLLRVILLAEGLYRAQSTALLVAMFLPLIGNVLYTFGLLPAGIDPTNIGFLFSGVIVAGTILRRQLLEVVPVAREIARDEILESMEDRVIVLDDRDNVADLNAAAVELLDCHEDEAIGRHVEELFPEIGTLVDEGGDKRLQSELSLERNGVRRYYDVRVTPLHRARGVIAGHLVSLRDVTQKRQRRQRLDVLNRLLRHNLRNDLNVIAGNAELVERDLDDGRLAGRVQEIERTAQEMSTRSDKIGRVARLLDDEGDQWVDISTIVAEEVADARERHPEATFETDIRPDLRAAAGQSAAVAVGELVANAVEHNDADEPTVSVTVSEVDGTVVVEVVDNGPGIHEQELEVLNQGKETALQHGSGVGLWVVNWIVGQFGGQLDFDTDGDGCTARLRLPMPSDSSGEPEPNPAD
jgi:PAS domain S-box-containing protein